MDTIDQNQSPFPAQPAPRSGNIGPLAAAVVIVMLLAAAGFHFFYAQQRKQQAEDAAQALQATHRVRGSQPLAGGDEREAEEGAGCFITNADEVGVVAVVPEDVLVGVDDHGLARRAV